MLRQRDVVSVSGRRCRGVRTDGRHVLAVGGDDERRRRERHPAYGDRDDGGVDREQEGGRRGFAVRRVPDGDQHRPRGRAVARERHEQQHRHQQDDQWHDLPKPPRKPPLRGDREAPESQQRTLQTEPGAWRSPELSGEQRRGQYPEGDTPSGGRDELGACQDAIIDRQRAQPGEGTLRTLPRDQPVAPQQREQDVHVEHGRHPWSDPLRRQTHRRCTQQEDAGNRQSDGPTVETEVLADQGAESV